MSLLRDDTEEKGPDSNQGILIKYLPIESTANSRSHIFTYSYLYALNVCIYVCGPLQSVGIYTYIIILCYVASGVRLVYYVNLK